MSELSTPALLSEFRRTGDENALLGAFSAGKAALARCDRADPSYLTALNELTEVLFAYFEHTGHFAVIDCAVELTRRRSALTGEAGEVGPWPLRHPTWEGGSFTRALSDSAWSLLHPDGRISLVWKDWSDWDGEGWPIGWNVRRPDGMVIELGEDQWGDDWHLEPDVEAKFVSPVRRQARTIVEAATLVDEPYRSEVAVLNEDELNVISEHLSIWNNRNHFPPDTLRVLEKAWRSNLPHPDAMLGNAYGWLVVALLDRAVIGLLREVLAHQRDVRRYLHTSGPDHLDMDMLLGFQNHWAQVRENFPPTDSLRSALRPIGGIPGPSLEENPIFWDTFRSVDRFRAVDQLGLSPDWADFSVQPTTCGSEVWHRDLTTGEMERVETRPDYAQLDRWLGDLSLLCAFAHVTCAPPETVAMYQLVTGPAN